LTEYQESLKCYNKAIEIDPQYPNAWNNKGAALASVASIIKCRKA